MWPGRAAVAVGYSVPAGAASGQEESVESFCAEDVTAELRYRNRSDAILARVSLARDMTAREVNQ